MSRCDTKLLAHLSEEGVTAVHTLPFSCWLTPFLTITAADVAAHWMLHSLQKALLHWSRKLETCGAFQ